MSGSNLLFIVTGSIAAYKACDVLSRLVASGHRVRVVATSAALRFVGSATLEGLSGQPVLTDVFADGAALEHIQLTRWADLIIICPATANTLNRFAAGLADDLPGALFLAHDRSKPFLIAPAMNPAMWAHPATLGAVATLRSWGLQILPVADGRTACGEIGEGRMIEPAEIVAAVDAALARPARRLRVLITSGGTSEPIDGVRVLSNTSTGRTGAGLAKYFSRCGHAVTLLRARSAESAHAGGQEELFDSFADLDAALARLLASGKFDAVIHAAAVSDFGVASIEVDGVAQPPGQFKLPSTSAPVLKLSRHPKLLDQLRARSVGSNPRIVAFKLTHHAKAGVSQAAVAAILSTGAADYVVHNDLAARSPHGDFPATVYSANGDAPLPCPSRLDLAVTLEQLLVAAPADVSAAS